MLRNLLLCLIISSCSFRSEISNQGPCEEKIRFKIKKILSQNLDLSKGPPLNAFTHINTQAIEDARRLDETEKKGSLHCVPIVVKDNIDTYDMPTSSGTLALLGSQSEKDAQIVQRLREAGAIVLGKTSMDELASGIFGYASRHGRTGNAYNTHESPGGSSAGSAVAVAADFAEIGIGTDNSGSIRIPAMFNGLIGLRPTKGLLSEEGIFPRGKIDGVPGPIAVYAKTIAKSMDVMLNANEFEKILSKDSLKNKRIGIVHFVNSYDVFKNTSSEFDKSFANLILNMEKSGAVIVKEISFPKFISYRNHNTAGDHENVDAYLKSFVSTRKSFEDVCESDRTGLWTVSRCLKHLKTTAALKSARYKQVQNTILNNQKYVHEIMEKENLDALLLPVSRVGYASEGDDHFNTFTASLSSNAGLPAIAFVMGYTETSLPIGIQVIGKAYSDKDLVNYIYALESLLPPYRTPQIPEGTSPWTIYDMNAKITELGAASLPVIRAHDGRLSAEEFERIAREVLKKSF